MGATLGDLAAWYDEIGFVGRSPELDIVQRLLDRNDGHIVLVHGPGGIGKSALLREIGRRAERAERPVISLDLRDATPSPDALDPVREAAGYDRPVVIIDTFEHVAALEAYLRGEVLPALPIGALVVVASRFPPANAWRSTHWEQVTTALELEPLSTRDATALLRARGLVEQAAVDHALRWTGGNPLGLALAAEHAERTGDTDGDMPPLALAAQLTRRLLDEEAVPGDAHMRALVLASIARVTTPWLLRSVLGDPATADDAWTWLTRRSFITRSGTGIAPHELLARALRIEVRSSSPDVEQALRHRVVDVLAADAVAGGTTSTADLVHLVDTAAIRWGFGVNASKHHLDRLRPEDLPVLRDATNRVAPYAALLEPWLTPDTSGLYIVRSAEGEPAGVGLAFTTSTAPEAARRDPFVGPRLAHARANFAGEVVVWHSSVSVEDDPIGAVQGLLGIGGYHATATPNPVATYIVVTPSRPSAVAFAEAVGGVRVPELDAYLDDGERIEVHVIDHGTDGLVQHIHRTVYTELGLPQSSRMTPPPGLTPDVDEVRVALRCLQSDRTLAATTLATRLITADATRSERAAALRQVLLDAVAAAWPDPKCEERVALDVAYLQPVSGDPSRRMHMSRSSWFRLLRRAVDGVVECLGPRISARAVEDPVPSA